jgi:hypothetical protein
MNCPNCKEILPPDYSAAWCPFCGKNLAVAKNDLDKKQSPPLKIIWWNFFAVLLAPALLTTLVALFKSPGATTFCVLCSSPMAGIIAGVLLSRLNAGNIGLRMLLMLFYASLFSFFCLVSCFFGCSLAGGGGIRFGG